MALTGSSKELVQRNVAADPAFGEAPLREGIDTCQRRSKFPQFGRSNFPQVRGDEIRQRQAMRAVWAGGRGDAAAG
jgi:hypothetical protein